jgi:DNA-binding response OmpR family regulator
VGLARAFHAAGSVFTAVNDRGRLLDSAAQFEPDLILVFAHPSPTDAMQRVASLRSETRFTSVAIVLIANMPPADTRGVTRVMPDPSDVGEFASRLIRLLEQDAPGPSGPPLELEGIEIEEIPALSSRLLLVDDDPALVRLFSAMMAKSGFEVVTAADGQEGLEVALDQRPDLVIADLDMPRLDGWGLLRALRADHRIGEVPLIFLSSQDDYRESLKAMQAGAQDYVAKGGKLDALVARVRAVLAPRDAFLTSVYAGERAHTRIQDVGLQWTLRRLASLQASGVIQARDPFWTLQLGFDAGQLVHAAAASGADRLEGAAALASLVVMRVGDLLFDPRAGLPSRNFFGPANALLEDTAVRTNDAEAAALDQLLAQATNVEIDEPLYQLYEQWGPPSTRDIAALVRQGLPPREVIARSDRSPLDVEDTLRDLVRRRVIRLTAQA